MTFDCLSDLARCQTELTELAHLIQRLLWLEGGLPITSTDLEKRISMQVITNVVFIPELMLIVQLSSLNICSILQLVEHTCLFTNTASTFSNRKSPCWVYREAVTLLFVVSESHPRQTQEEVRKSVWPLKDFVPCRSYGRSGRTDFGL